MIVIPHKPKREIQGYKHTQCLHPLIFHNCSTSWNEHFYTGIVARLQCLFYNYLRTKVLCLHFTHHAAAPVFVLIAFVNVITITSISLHWYTVKLLLTMFIADCTETVFNSFQLERDFRTPWHRLTLTPVHRDTGTRWHLDTGTPWYRAT